MRMSYAFTVLLAAGLLTFTYACSDDAGDGSTSTESDAGSETNSAKDDSGTPTGPRDAGNDARDAKSPTVPDDDAGDASDGATEPELPKIMVVRAGKLDGTLLGTAALDVFLDEYDLKTNKVVRSITLPTADDGDNRKLVLSKAGTGVSEGALSLSPDGRSVTLTGYSTYQTDQVLPPFFILPPADLSSAPRVVGNVQADGSIDTSTLLSDAFVGLTSVAGAVRSGTDVWIAGTTQGDRSPIQHLTLGNSKNGGATTGGDVLGAAGPHVVVRIFEGQLYATTLGASDGKLVSIGTGTPTSSGQSEASVLEGLASPFEFEFLDLDAKPGAERVYVAVSSDAGGGVARYDYDSTAKTWSLKTTFTDGLTKGAYGIAAYQDGTDVVLLTTTFEGDKLVRFVDKDGTASTSTVIATAPTGVLYRGVTFSPNP